MPTPSSSSAPEGGLRAPKPVLAVAIDFGTYASGFAYAPIPQHQPQPGQPHAAPRVSLHTAWPGQPAPDPKTRTAVLYRGRTLVSAKCMLLACCAQLAAVGCRSGQIICGYWRITMSCCWRLQQAILTPMRSRSHKNA